MYKRGRFFLIENQRFDDLVELGSEPQGSSQPVQPQPQPEPEARADFKPIKKKKAGRSDWTVTFLSLIVVILIGVTLLFWVVAKYRAENLTAALAPHQLQGLSFEEREFNPYTEVKYVQIQEGLDRNPGVINLGSTLPIISRFNFKTFTDKNYEVVGAAQWALTTNFESNLYDPEMMEYLLSNKTMIQAFVSRPDVEPLLTDPQMLLAFTEDNAAMRDFFEDSTVQAVLENEKMVHVVARSRFMNQLLTSPTGKYFREHPQEAIFAIRNNSYLMQALQNPYIQKEVKDSPYLKPIASILTETNTAEQPANNKAATPVAPKKQAVVAKTSQSAQRTTSKVTTSRTPAKTTRPATAKPSQTTQQATAPAKQSVRRTTTGTNRNTRSAASKNRVYKAF